MEPEIKITKDMFDEGNDMDIITTHFLRKYDDVNNDLLLVSYATTDLLRVFTEIVKGRQEPYEGANEIRHIICSCVAQAEAIARKECEKKDVLKRTLP